MSAKAKFVYAKPFITHEKFGIEKVIKHDQVYGFKNKLLDAKFIQPFRDYDFYDSDFTVEKSYAEMVNIFGKPIKVTGKFKDAKCFYSFSNQMSWTVDAVWYLLLQDQSYRGKKIEVPVIIYNLNGGKNYNRFYDKARAENLVEDFGDRFPKAYRMNNKLSNVNCWNIIIGSHWRHNEHERTKPENQLYIENLINLGV